MRRLLGGLRSACFFMLCYAAVPLLASHLLLKDCRIGLAMMLLLLPVSFVLAFIPGKVGGGNKEEMPVVRASRGNDPDPDRGLRNEELPLPQKRAFALCAVCCAFACAGMAIGMYHIPATLSAGIVKRILMVSIIAAMLPLSLRVFVLQEEDNASMIAGVVLYMLCGCAAHFIKDIVFEQWLTGCAFAFLLLSAFVLNDGSMNRGTAREGVRPPASMRRRNRLMLGTLTVIGGIVLYFDKIRHVVSQASWWIFRMIGKFIAWLFNLGAPEEVSSGVSSGGGRMDMAGIFGTSKESSFWAFMEKIMFVIVIAAVLLLIVLFGRRIWNILTDITRRLIARLRRLTAAVSEEYQDEQESLFDWGETTKELGEGLRERMQRLLKHEKRYEQLDVREKMRYIVRSLYRRSKHPRMLRNLTVHEAVQEISTGEARGEEIAQIYDQARYAQQEPDVQTVDRLRKEAKV